jgi:hypothetical protein
LLNTSPIARKGARVIPARQIAAGLGAALVVACQSSTTPLSYTPITGIIVPAANIVAGHGCGTGPDQVYKYVVAVAYAGADGGPTCLLYLGVFDCFADGVFEMLPYDGGSMTYALSVYAYDKAGYPSSLDVCTPGACYPSPSMAGEFAAAAQWETTCAATQQQGAPSSANCGPLADGGAPPASPVCGAPPTGPDSGDAGGSGDAAGDSVTPDGSSDVASDTDAAVGDQASPTDATVDVVSD